MTKVRPPWVPTLKKWTFFVPLSFCGVCEKSALYGDEGTKASMWNANNDWKKAIKMMPA
jgi:hypothetical protein